MSPARNEVFHLPTPKGAPLWGGEMKDPGNEVVDQPVMGRPRMKAKAKGLLYCANYLYIYIDILCNYLDII